MISRSPLPPSRGSHALLLMALPVALLLAVAPAAGQRPAASSEAVDTHERAARLTARAEQLYLAEDFVHALAHYREAYLTVPAPALLFNLGQCHRKLDNFEQAAIFFHVYLQIDPSSPYREMVEGLVAESRIQHSIATAGVPQPAPPEREKGSQPAQRVTGPSSGADSEPAEARKDHRWSRKQRRWAWALGSVALIAGSSAVLATTLHRSRDDPHTMSTSSLGVVDWR